MGSRAYFCTKIIRILKKLFLLNLLVINVLIANQCATAAQIEVLEIFSASMRKNIPCLVITPSDYRTDGEPYPVVYLLHGHGGDYKGWLEDAPQLRQHADTYQIIIVCPDGGNDSWYLDSPVDTSLRYETHLAMEVVAFVDQRYHTRREASGRAIAGLSMGGHGALSLAIKHSEVFGAAGSMAGGLDLRPFRKNNWNLHGILGDAARHCTNWEEASVVNLVPKLKGSNLALIIDCGLGDFFLDVNREMHRRLLEIKYPHVYTERPGEHNGMYWGSAVDDQLLFFHKFFNR